MTNETKIRIIEALEAYLKQHGMSQNEFARKVAMNAAYISTMRAGDFKMPAGKGKTVEIGEQYFKRVADGIGLKLGKQYWGIVATPQLKRILATLEDSRMHGSTNVIIGETGSGKSFAAKLFAEKNPLDIFHITVGQSDNISDLLDKIIEKMNVIVLAKSKSKKIRGISSHLKSLQFSGQCPQLIFDEAEYMKQPALCAMKELYDNLHGICSIVMIGTEQLITNLDKLRNKNKAGIPQLYRRIKFGIRRLPNINRAFTDFIKELKLQDKSLIRFLKDNCENYGELHDVLVPAMREADRTGDELTEDFVRTMLNMPKSIC